MRRRHLGPHRFVWRIYLHGLLLLAIVAVAVIAVGRALGGPHGGGDPERLVAYVSARVAELGWDPDRLAVELARLGELGGRTLTVYRTGGELVATGARPPAPPLDADEVRTLTRRPFPALHGAVPIVEGGRTVGYLAIARRPGDLDGGTRALLLLGAVLVALAVGSLPLARALGRPVERITAAVRRFGEGDLGARTGVIRHDELGQLARAFDEMAARIAALVASEKELLAAVSHELRTPLARIRVGLELAQEGEGERARRHLAGIERDLAELDGLLENVLTAARLELGTSRVSPAALPVRREPVESTRLLDRAAARFAELHPDRRLVRQGNAGGLRLEGDPTLLRRALDNLLDNAAKYSTAPAEVRLVARATDGRLEIAIEDRGIGIAPEDLPRLFTPFFRTDRSRARGTGGVGLGLALARRIVESHGGTVRLESRPGEGTVATVVLPASAGA